MSVIGFKGLDNLELRGRADDRTDIFQGFRDNKK